MGDFMYLHEQIFSNLEYGILSGKLPPGYRIPSVRVLAVQYQVNPNTVQRATKELERAGLLISKKGKGMTVTENKDMICCLRKDRAEKIVHSFVAQMEMLGYSREEILHPISYEKT